MTAPLAKKKSALHRKVVELIREAFPSFTLFEEKAVRVRLSGRDTTVFVDIIVKELNLAIECHGRQHFKFVSHFHGDRQKFADACERDAAKAESLIDAGYTFLIVRFDEEKNLTVADLLDRITKAITEAPK